MTACLLLDEHVGRVFERVLRERGYEVRQAKDEFGERTDDAELLRWCRDEDPERLARAVEEVLEQYETVANELVVLDEWYDWLHE